jgi:hypothetical protein
MPAPGRGVNLAFTIVEPQEVVCQALLTGTTGVRGYTVTTAGISSLILTRRYTPTWARMLAIYGIWLALISLLALFIKRTETLSVTLIPVPEGTNIILAGVASREMIGRLDAVLDGMPVVTPGADG